MVDITNVGGSASIPKPPSPPVLGKESKISADIPFKEILKSAIGFVNDYQLAAADAQERLLTGKTDNVVEVLVAVRKAEQIFNLLVQIRNKLVDAFEEIMRMRI